MVNEMKKEEKEVERCEFCEETFATEEKLTLHVNHAHYRDTYKAVDRERRNWAKQCLARSVGKTRIMDQISFFQHAGVQEEAGGEEGAGGADGRRGQGPRLPGGVGDGWGGGEHSCSF